MPGLIKIKEQLFVKQKVIRTIGFIICSPFVLTILNLLLQTLFNLGIYTGTFLRFLYEFVVY